MACGGDSEIYEKKIHLNDKENWNKYTNQKTKTSISQNSSRLDFESCTTVFLPILSSKLVDKMNKIKEKRKKG